MHANMNALLATAVLALGTLSRADKIKLNFQHKAVANDSSSACPQPGGAHIIVARASTEAPGFGIIGVVKDAVLDHVPGSTAEAVDYPATLSEYPLSESDGVVAMKGLVDAFVANCPAAPLVLLGYSQGAQVTADTLVGQQDAGFGDNATISSAPAGSTIDRVAAGILMGDPSFTTTETFHVGNATKNGLFARQNVAAFQNGDLASRMKSYCNDGDPYCAGGNFSTVRVHLLYVAEYGNSSAQFVVDQIKAWYERNPAGTSANGTATGLPVITPTPAASGSKNGTWAPSGTGAPASSKTSGAPVAATGAASAVQQQMGLLATVLLGGVFALAL